MTYFYHGASATSGPESIQKSIRDYPQDTPHSVGLFWMSVQPDAETSTRQHTQTSMPLAGFEPTIPASERPQTHALNGAATGSGKITITQNLLRKISNNRKNSI